MSRHESTVVSVRWSEGNAAGAAKKLQKVLDKHDAEGWQTVSVVSSGGGLFRKSGALLIFRRPAAG